MITLGAFRYRNSAGRSGGAFLSSLNRDSGQLRGEREVSDQSSIERLKCGEVDVDTNICLLSTTLHRLRCRQDVRTACRECSMRSVLLPQHERWWKSGRSSDNASVLSLLQFQSSPQLPVLEQQAGVMLSRLSLRVDDVSPWCTILRTATWTRLRINCVQWPTSWFFQRLPHLVAAVTAVRTDCRRLNAARHHTRLVNGSGELSPATRTRARIPWVPRPTSLSPSCSVVLATACPPCRRSMMSGCRLPTAVSLLLRLAVSSG